MAEDFKGLLLQAETDLTTKAERDASHGRGATRPPLWTTTAPSM